MTLSILHQEFVNNGKWVQVMFGLIAGALTIAVLIFIGLPLFSDRKQSAGPVVAKPRQSPRLTERQVDIEREIQELEFDYRVGKLSQADFDLEYARLQDSLTQVNHRQKTPARKTEPVDPLEEEIARYRERRKSQK